MAWKRVLESPIEPAVSAAHTVGSLNIAIKRIGQGYLRDIEETVKENPHRRLRYRILLVRDDE